MDHWSQRSAVRNTFRWIQRGRDGGREAQKTTQENVWLSKLLFHFPYAFFPSQSVLILGNTVLNGLFITVLHSEWFVLLVRHCEINTNQKQVYLTFPLEWKPSPGTFCVKAPLTLHAIYMTSTKLSPCLH